MPHGRDPRQAKSALPFTTASSAACTRGIKPLVTLSHHEMPHILVSAGTGEMRKRYGFIHVDKYDDGTGTYERRRGKGFGKGLRFRPSP